MKKTNKNTKMKEKKKKNNNNNNNNLDALTLLTLCLASPVNHDTNTEYVEDKEGNNDTKIPPLI
jgi:hypothetical protein